MPFRSRLIRPLALLLPEESSLINFRCCCRIQQLQLPPTRLTALLCCSAPASTSGIMPCGYHPCSGALLSLTRPELHLMGKRWDKRHCSRVHLIAVEMLFY